VDLSVPIKGSLVIGRAADQADVFIDDQRISRAHLKFTNSRSHLAMVEDLGSKNGTFVNGRRIQEKSALDEGDVIRAGSSFFVITVASFERGVEDKENAVIGDSRKFKEVVTRLLQGASSDASVLLMGETGTGKDVMATLAHRVCETSRKFVPVNCAAIPEELVDSMLFGHERGAFTGADRARAGFFREADGGTLFLDEIGDLPLQVQPRLLRALESGEVTPVGASRPVYVKVRVVAATNIDLETAVEKGRFRADLFARLTGWVVELPALRERRDDILRMARYFRGDPTRVVGELPWDPDLVEALLLYNWPYNIRELRQIVDQLKIGNDEDYFAFDTLPNKITRFYDEVREGAPVVRSENRERQSLAFEGEECHTVSDMPRGSGRRPNTPKRDELLKILEELDHNVSAVARFYQRDRKQVYRWMKRHGISPDENQG
jgi:transcriptional regulator with GAF, ATPase, and Fis domain